MHKYELSRPFKFLSTKGLESPGRMHSIINKEEANVALALYERMRTDNPRENFDFRIGVVTMYKAQVFELKRVFQQRYGMDITDRIDFNTVDGFQGQEKDIIILSCVRSAAEPRSIGFLGDRRRLNVAVTRAKSNLFVIGNAAHLRRGDPIWERLVATAEQQGALQPITVAMLQKGDRTLAKKPRHHSAEAALDRQCCCQQRRYASQGRATSWSATCKTTINGHSSGDNFDFVRAAACQRERRNPPQATAEPGGLPAAKVEAAEKKRKAIVVEDPRLAPKKPRVSDESVDHGKTQSRGAPPSKPGGSVAVNGRVKVGPNGNGAPVRPAPSGGPADQLPAGKLREPHDRVRRDRRQASRRSQCRR